MTIRRGYSVCSTEGLSPTQAEQATNKFCKYGVAWLHRTLDIIHILAVDQQAQRWCQVPSMYSASPPSVLYCSSPPFLLQHTLSLSHHTHGPKRVATLAARACINKPYFLFFFYTRVSRPTAIPSFQFTLASTALYRPLIHVIQHSLVTRQRPGSAPSEPSIRYFPSRRDLDLEATALSSDTHSRFRVFGTCKTI